MAARRTALLLLALCCLLASSQARKGPEDGSAHRGDGKGEHGHHAEAHHGEGKGNHSHHGDHHGPHGPHPPHPPHEPFVLPYEVLNKTVIDGVVIEERLLNASTWVSVNASGWSWETSLPSAVKKLIGYTHGRNQKDKHFPPSAPLLSRFVSKSRDYSDCKSTFETSIWLPKKPGCNATAPEPLDQNMKVQTYPGGKIYARTFPGFAFSWTFKAEAFKLAKALTKAQVSIHEGLFAAAVYDPPFKFFHRRNEVWFAPLPTNGTATSVVAGMQTISSPQLQAAQQAMMTSA